MRDLLDSCPSCGGQWSYIDSNSGKKFWDGVGGNVVNDRVESWLCLHCQSRWARGDATILQPKREGATDGPHE